MVVDLWIKNTIEFGFDGYRLDGPNGVSSFEQVLSVWDEIAWECRNKGMRLLLWVKTVVTILDNVIEITLVMIWQLIFSPNPAICNYAD